MTAKEKGFLDVNPRSPIDHLIYAWESCLTNVFHVLSMQKTDKLFRALFKEFLSCTPYEEIFKQATWMLNLTNVGLSMCIKEYSDLFSECDDKICCLKS